MHLWFWSWVTIAVVLALGESVTGGLFVLPWAVGAALAALLDGIGVGIGWQWIAFLGVSSVMLVTVQRLRARRR